MIMFQFWDLQKLNQVCHFVSFEDSPWTLYVAIFQIGLCEFICCMKLDMETNGLVVISLLLWKEESLLLVMFVLFIDVGSICGRGLVVFLVACVFKGCLWRILISCC